MGSSAARRAAQEGLKYSAALKATGATWTEAILDKYLANPQAFAPGAFMPINLPSADERKAVIGYLKTLGPAAPGQHDHHQEEDHGDHPPRPSRRP